MIIIAIVYILISAVFTSAFKKKYGFTMNPHAFFTWFWSFCAILTLFFKYLGIREVGILIHVYSILFLLSFNIFSVLCSLGPQNKVWYSRNYQLDLPKINTKMYIFEAIALALYSRYFFMSLTALLAGNAAIIRSEIYFSQQDTFFTRLIPTAVINAIVYISLFLYYKTKNKLYITNAIILVVIESITSMGRGALLSFVIINILFIILEKHKLKLNSKPLFIGLISVAALTVFVRGSDFFRTFVTYFSGSFAFLDYIVNNPTEYGLNNYHYGIITLSPITEPVMYVLKAIGVTTEKIPSYWLNINVQNFVDIGDVNNIVDYNNNTTALFPFLLDFGILGVSFGGALLGFLSMALYRGLISSSPVYSLIYLYVIGGLFTLTMSYQRFMGVTPFVVIACFVIIMKMKRKPIVSKKQIYG